jgi:hypothetical protein
MASQLSNVEYRQLAQFLKRWGIDHPELLAEMTDHYSEKALAEMSKGKSFNLVLDNWKTKETFRMLRKIQREYEDIYPERWKKTQWRVAKSIIFSQKILWFIGLLLVFVGIYTIPLTRLAFEYLFALKVATSFGIMLYFFIRKRYRRIISFRNFGFYYIFYVTLLQLAFNVVWPDDPIKVSNNILVPILLGISVFVDYIYFQLWQITIRETSHLSDEMLEDHVPAQHNPAKH